MQFGLLFEMQRPFEGTTVDWNTLYKETLEQCAFADQLGYDMLWFVEHHFLIGFSGSPCPEVMFGALSQVTKRIRLGFGVCILPNHHPVRVAERVAMLDQLTDGRIEVGTGRSNAYEQLGQGIDPRDTRAMWEESITMLPKIWQSDEFSHEGQFWKVPTRRVLPKPYQSPHPRLYLACTQTDSFNVAADHGIGVLSSGTFATNILAEHVRNYRERVKRSTPVGAFVNEFWGNNVMAYCGADDAEAKELGAQSLKDFFGPTKPYIRDRVNAVNRAFRNEHGESMVEVDPSCRELIADLEQVISDGRGGIKKTTDRKSPYFRRTHTSDALGYWISMEEPVRQYTSGPQKGPVRISAPGYAWSNG